MSASFTKGGNLSFLRVFCRSREPLLTKQLQGSEGSILQPAFKTKSVANSVSMDSLGDQFDFPNSSLKLEEDQCGFWLPHNQDYETSQIPLLDATAAFDLP